MLKVHVGMMSVTKADNKHGQCNRNRQKPSVSELKTKSRQQKYSMRMLIMNGNHVEPSVSIK